MSLVNLLFHMVLRYYFEGQPNSISVSHTNMNSSSMLACFTSCDNEVDYYHYFITGLQLSLTTPL